MIIPCPRCQARLNLPETADGSEVRCPTCRHVFVAVAEAGQESSEKRTPMSPAPLPRDYQAYERPRSPDDDDDIDIPKLPADRGILEDNAKEHTRPAGYMMMAAFSMTLAGLVVNRILTLVEDFDRGRGNNNPFAEELQILAIIVRVVVFAPLLLVVLCAGRNLLRLGSRGMIKTAIFANFLLLLLFAVGVLRDLLTLAVPFPNTPAVLIPQIIVGGLCAAVNLAAAILTLRALAQHHVVAFYDRNRERMGRYRY